jgi:hypothetical protein
MAKSRCLSCALDPAHGKPPSGGLIHIAPAISPTPSAHTPTLLGSRRRTRLRRCAPHLPLPCHQAHPTPARPAAAATAASGSTPGEGAPHCARWPAQRAPTAPFCAMPALCPAHRLAAATARGSAPGEGAAPLQHLRPHPQPLSTPPRPPSATAGDPSPHRWPPEKGRRKGRGEEGEEEEEKGRRRGGGKKEEEEKEEKGVAGCRAHRVCLATPRRSSADTVSTIVLHCTQGSCCSGCQPSCCCVSRPSCRYGY